uniref:Uncharacterized protein n=1 Tax=Magallana gigas TaxID=29159 RepID=A0A8W8JLY6_MAGGI
MNDNRHKRFTEIDICYETNNTLGFVSQCPKNDSLFQERSRRKNCKTLPQCTGEPLVYHCVRFREELVEVCTPRGLITGFCCALFDEGVGRVVEDYFNPCSDCPFVYQSDDVSKYSKCVGKKKDTSTPGRYKKYTAIADEKHSFETKEKTYNKKGNLEKVILSVFHLQHLFYWFSSSGSQSDIENMLRNVPHHPQKTGFNMTII